MIVTTMPPTNPGRVEPVEVPETWPDQSECALGCQSRRIAVLGRHTANAPSFWRARKSRVGIRPTSFPAIRPTHTTAAVKNRFAKTDHDHFGEFLA